MIPRRFLALLVLILLLPACGGGGGGGPGVPDVDPPPPDEVDETTRQILQICLPDALSAFDGMFAALADLLAGQGGTEGFAVVPGSIVADDEILQLELSYDANGDMTPDGQGPMAFFDDAGLPVNPFDPGQITTLETSGVDAFGTLLATLPDGYRVTLQLLGSSAFPETDADWLFLSGAASQVSGGVRQEDANCSVGLGLVDQDWGDLFGPFPDGTFPLDIARQADLVIGTIVMDGTKDALIDVSRNLDPDTAWTFDLQTGQATPR